MSAALGPHTAPRHLSLRVDSAYLNRLSYGIQQIVEEIEMSAELEITLEVRAPDSDALRQGRKPLKCEVDPHSARIIIPSDDYFPEGSVLHELLHLRRILTERVPRLTFCHDYDPWSPQFETALTNLDNSLEHLVIVPEELIHRPERKTYWTKVMRRVLADLSSPHRPDGDRERLALQNTGFVSTVLDDLLLVSDFATLLEELGVMERAEVLLGSIRTSLRSKEQLAKAFVTQLRIPAERICLEYIDTKLGTSREVHLSEIA